MLLSRESSGQHLTEFTLIPLQLPSGTDLGSPASAVFDSVYLVIFHIYSEITAVTAPAAGNLNWFGNIDRQLCGRCLELSFCTYDASVTAVSLYFYDFIPFHQYCERAGIITALAVDIYKFQCGFSFRSHCSCRSGSGGYLFIVCFLLSQFLI